jgi:hypothetical protein
MCVCVCLCVWYVCMYSAMAYMCGTSCMYGVHVWCVYVVCGVCCMCIGMVCVHV